MRLAQGFRPSDDVTCMGEFGTGLRAHLERGRDDELAPAPVADAPSAEVAAQLARLAEREAALAGRELELAQREADLEAARERLALTLAGALIRAAEESNVPPPLDEVALARARRYGSA